MKKVSSSKIISILLIVTLVAIMVVTLTSCNTIKGLWNKITGGSDDCGDNHTWSADPIKDTATCTADGIKTYKCQKCGATMEMKSNAKGHEYDDYVVTVPATCTTDGKKMKECSRCHDKVTETITALGHDWDEGHSLDATCLVADDITYKCKRDGCDGSKIVTGSKLPCRAADDAVYQKDETQHWKNCKWCGNKVDSTIANHDYEETVVSQWDCIHDGIVKYTCECGKEYEDNHPADPSVHYHAVIERVEPTCATDGYISYADCPGCHASKANDILPKTSVHTYNGYVCDVCGRDEMLDYSTAWEGHGTSHTDLITINSEKELIFLLDYATVNIDMVYFKFSDSYDKPISSDATPYIQGLLPQMTAANWTMTTGSGTYGTKYYMLGVNKTEYQTNAYKYVCGTDYTDMSLPERPSPLIKNLTTGRTAGFTNFPYKSRTNTLDVEYSDQLYFAFAHGYKPVCKASSPAEAVLAETEEIMRNIVDDTMTDTQKLLAIYQWLLDNVQYDHGAVDVTNKHLMSSPNVKGWAVEGVLDEGRGVCDAISKTYCILAGIENIKCIQASGDAHAWNKVFVDGDGNGTKEWYVIDVTHGNASMKINAYEEVEEGTYSFFMFTDETRTTQGNEDINGIAHGYTAANYTTCIANTTFNVYKTLHYGAGTENETNDYYIESQSEMSNYFASFKSSANSIKGTSNMIVLEFCVKSGSLVDIYAALSTNGYYGFSISSSQTTNFNSTGDTVYTYFIKSA